MSYPKFHEYVNGKGKLVEKPVVKQVADKLEAEPNKPPKECGCLKEKGKQPQIKEYLDGKGKLVERPPTELIPDGPKPTAAPEKAVTKGKNWTMNVPANSEAPKPYVAPGSSKPVKAESGLADKGETKYEPDTKGGNSPFIPGGKAAKDYNSKTEQFLNQTRKMSIGEFAKHMLKEGCAVDPQKPFIPTLINDLVSMSQENPKVLENLVHELKRRGLLPQLAEMIEAVGPPIGIGDDLEDDEEDLEDDEDNLEDDEEDLEDDEDALADDEEDLEDDEEDLEDDEDAALGGEEGEGEEDMPLPPPHKPMMGAMMGRGPMMGGGPGM